MPEPPPLLAFPLLHVDAVELSIDNFLELTEGKTVFIKLYAPWCQHCEEIRPAWEKLTEDWKDHEIGLVGRVDCESEGGNPICEEYDVTSFPAFMYGDPMSPEIYSGPTDYEALSAFAKEHISKPICSVTTMEYCDETTIALIKELQGKSGEELEKMEEAVMKQIETEQEKFDKQLEVIQQQYEAFVKEYNTKVDEIRAETNFKWIQQVLNEMEGSPLDMDDGMQDEF